MLNFNPKHLQFLKILGQKVRLSISASISAAAKQKENLI